MERPALENFLSEAGISGHAADSLRAQAYSDDLKLYLVENKANRRVLFLAETPYYAQLLAVKSGHLQEPNNGRVLVPNERYFAQFRGFEGAVKRAVAKRKPGLVERKGEFAVLDGDVYTPIGPV